jgi:hypothetical protein
MRENRCWARYLNRVRCQGMRGHHGKHWVRDDAGIRFRWENSSDLKKRIIGTQAELEEARQQQPF